MAIRDLLEKEWLNVKRLRYVHITYEAARCVGCWQCYEVCPVGLWTPGDEARAVQFNGPDGCVACGACVLQCPEGAIRLRT
jgi:NAD-dependent dihydropyrimidine dehydrogenase PreA subunit